MSILVNYVKSTDRNLNSEGYSFFPSSIRPELFTVAKPDQSGVYNVDTVRGTCDCAAGKRGTYCCHLREATARAVAAHAQAMADSFENDRAAFEKIRSLDFD